MAGTPHPHADRVTFGPLALMMWTRTDVVEEEEEG